MQLFWRQGYAATSVDDLSETLHLSRSSLYATFGDKRTLFLEALRRYSASVISRTTQTLVEATTPETGIASLFADVAAGVSSESSTRGCFMVNAVAELVPFDAEVTAIAVAYSDALQQLLVDALRQRTGAQMTIGEQSPEQLATYLFNTLQGLRILIKAGATRDQVDAVIAITLHSLN